MRRRSSRDEGDRPTKHSYEVLASAGALDDSARGRATLYMILASEADKERPRKTEGGVQVGVDDERSWMIHRGGDLGAAFATSDAARKSLEEVRALQAILKEYRAELIAEKYLTE